MGRGGGAYLFQAHLRGGGGLIEAGHLFNLEMMMVSVLYKELEYIYKELEYKVEKLQEKVQEVGGHTVEDQNQIWTSSK